jgi:hypothetical protein
MSLNLYSINGQRFLGLYEELSGIGSKTIITDYDIHRTLSLIGSAVRVSGEMALEPGDKPQAEFIFSSYPEGEQPKTSTLEEIQQGLFGLIIADEVDQIKREQALRFLQDRGTNFLQRAA